MPLHDTGWIFMRKGPQIIMQMVGIYGAVPIHKLRRSARLHKMFFKIRLRPPQLYPSDPDNPLPKTTPECKNY